MLDGVNDSLLGNVCFFLGGIGVKMVFVVKGEFLI